MLLSPARAPAVRPAAAAAANANARRALLLLRAPPTPAAAAAAMSARRPTQQQQQQRQRPLPTPPAAAAAENFSGDMLEPSAANKLPVRAAALAASVAAASYFGAPAVSAAATSFAHLLFLGTFTGAAVYTSFFAGILMFKNLPRQTFGRLQSKLFPVYFWILVTTALAAFGTLAASTPGGAPAAAATFGGRALLAAAAASLANAVWLEPRATEVMFERYAIENRYPGGAERSPEDAAKTTALGKKFGALHGASSLANLVALCAVVAYTWQLAGRLVLAA